MSEAVKIRLPKVLRGVRVLRTLPLFEEAGEASGKDDVHPSAVGLAALREEAYQEGYECARAEWSSRLAEVLASLDRESGRLNECRKEFTSSLERSVVDLALAVAEKFLISERERGNYCIRTIVHSILEKMSDPVGKLTIALNPKDLEELEDSGSLSEAEGFPSLRLSADPSVPLAGCRVETGLGRVAFSLEEQMEEIGQALERMEVPEDDGHERRY